MIFTKLTNGAILIEPTRYKDSRGFFMETYKKSIFKEHGILGEFTQDNHSFSVKNVIRGIHFQKNPKPQGKLVRCVQGEILDVAVDLRTFSPTFKQAISAKLSSENGSMLWVPCGFGHGFSVLSDTAEISYKCTNEYDSTLDAGVRWDSFEIDWQVTNPILSEKDLSLPLFKDIHDDREEWCHIGFF